MRIQHWLAAITSLLGPMVVGSTALAQSGPGWQAPPVPSGRAPVQQSAYQLPAPDPVLAQAPMVPPPFQPAFPSNNPNLLYPPAAPYGAQPWPAISPHLGPNVMQDQHFNRNGLWLNEAINRDRKWYGDIDYVHTTFDGAGEAWIGSAPAKLDKVSDDFPWIDPWPDGGPIGPGGGEPVPIGPGPYPFVYLHEAVDEFSNGIIGTTIIQPPEVFPIRKTDILDDNVGADGFRVRAGYFDNDGTGLGAEFWYGFQGGDIRQYGQDKINGIPITQDIIAGVDADGLFPSEITNPTGGFIPFTKVGALALNDPSGVINEMVIGLVGNGFTGTTQKYDLLYRVEDHISGGGADVKFFLGHVYKRPHAQIKSFTALKYIVIDESFQFRGLDSGFHYVVDIESDDDQAPIFRPEDGELIGPLYPLFESTLRSDVTTHLAGPEIGLRGDLGQSDGFKLWWTGAVGLLVNHEKADLRGQNIGNAHFFNANFGDPTTPDDDQGFGTIFGPAFDMFANDTRFHDTDTHTHISPSFQIGINAEIGLFDVLPGTRRLSFFDDAKLNLGYNTQLIGQVARAADSVRWEGFPGFPSVDIDYDTFQIHQLSIGLHFER